MLDPTAGGAAAEAAADSGSPEDGGDSVPTLAHVAEDDVLKRAAAVRVRRSGTVLLCRHGAGHSQDPAAAALLAM